MTIQGATVRHLLVPEVVDLLTWLDGGTAPALLGALGQPAWLLAHCDDGVTWGRWTGSKLDLSSRAVSAWPTPVPGPTNIQQLRVFAENAELLLWREESSPPQLEGRVLVDAATAGIPEALRPMEDVYLLAANDVARDGGPTPEDFTAVVAGNGRTQVVPLACDQRLFGDGQYRLGLELRHYLEQDDDTGCVRVAASRLLALRQLAADERVIQGRKEG